MRPFFAMNDQELLRYSRHILLEQIGIEGQQKLLEAHALIIGAGGLGCPSAAYLCSAGVGQITLVDHDSVDMTNLQRQILHTTDRIAMLKVDSARLSLHGINPHTQIHTVSERVDEARLMELVRGKSVVLDCSDNFATRHAINRACVAAGVPLVSGAALAFDGQISVFDSRLADSPCYACLFPAQDEYEETLCSSMGVFAPLVGIIGTMQAAEALKLIMGIGQSLAGRLLLLNGMHMEWTSIGIAKHHKCLVCQAK